MKIASLKDQQKATPYAYCSNKQRNFIVKPSNKLRKTTPTLSLPQATNKPFSSTVGCGVSTSRSVFPRIGLERHGLSFLTVSCGYIPTIHLSSVSNPTETTSEGQFTSFHGPSYQPSWISKRLSGRGRI